MIKTMTFKEPGEKNYITKYRILSIVRGLDKKDHNRTLSIVMPLNWTDNLSINHKQ